MNAGALVVTVVYGGLLAWGLGVGVRQIWQGWRRPQELLNPLFANRWAIRLFTLHIVVVSADLFVIGPLAIANKARSGTGAGGSRCCRRHCRWRPTSTATRSRSAS